MEIVQLALILRTVKFDEQVYKTLGLILLIAPSQLKSTDSFIMQQADSSVLLLELSKTYTIQREMDKGHVILCTANYSDCVVCYKLKDDAGFRKLDGCLSSKAAIKQFMTCRVFQSSGNGQTHYVEEGAITFTIHLKNKSHVLSFKTPEDMIPTKNIGNLFHVGGFSWDHYPSQKELTEAIAKRSEEMMKQNAEKQKMLDDVKAAAAARE